jgi:hypothetical protein
VVTNIRFGLNFLRLAEVLVKSSTQGRIPEYESIYCQLPNRHWPGRERSYCIRLLNWCAKIFLCFKMLHSKPVPHLPNDVISFPPTKELLAFGTFRPNLQLFLEMRFISNRGRGLVQVYSCRNLFYSCRLIMRSTL